VTKKYLGIDYGARRIGLAMADDEVRIASPRSTVDSAELIRIIEREGPFDQVVVGLPRGLDGQETPQTLAVRHFNDDVLWKRLRIEAVYQDEAGTSSLAEDRLKESGKPYDKKDIDYLDAL
jgi:putative Holliday junction resolvase